MSCKKTDHREHQTALSKPNKNRVNKCLLPNAAADVSEQFVPEQLVWTAQMKTFKVKMKQAAEQNFHDPSRCRRCTEKRAELELEAFIRRKTTQLQNRLLEEKIQSHLQNHSSAWLIAETLREFPKPSDGHGAIWQALTHMSPNCMSICSESDVNDAEMFY